MNKRYDQYALVNPNRQRGNINYPRAVHFIKRCRKTGPTVAVVLVLACSLALPKSAAATTYLGYELGEMVTNNFKRFAGEIGYQFENKSTVRLVYLDVVLSEQHLSSNIAGAVDGDNVEGLWRGFELYYDIPLTLRWSFGLSAGNSKSFYSHTILDESVGAQSGTVGFSFSYLGDNVLGMKQLYWRFSLPVRHYFNPIPRTQLGDTIVVGDESGLNLTPWIFVGYRF